jgi:RHS repeat-associated protein
MPWTVATCQTLTCLNPPTGALTCGRHPSAHRDRGRARRRPAGRPAYRLASGTVTCTRYYTHGSATVAVRTPAGLAWLAGDHQSSANITVNAGTGATTKRWYTLYGADRNTVTWPTGRGFLNKQTNTSTGLTDVGAREYDPSYGTFLSPDPLINIAEPTSCCRQLGTVALTAVRHEALFVRMEVRDLHDLVVVAVG